MNEEKVAQIFKAFCDPNRLAILQLLQYGERCGCELLEQMSIGQPTLSHHMRILCDANVVQSRKVGKMTFYMLCGDGIERAKHLLHEYTQVKGQILSAYVK